MTARNGERRENYRRILVVLLLIVVREGGGWEKESFHHSITMGATIASSLVVDVRFYGPKIRAKV